MGVPLRDAAGAASHAVPALMLASAPLAALAAPAAGALLARPPGGDRVRALRLLLAVAAGTEAACFAAFSFAPRRFAGALFFILHSLLNLVTTSALWARCGHVGLVSGGGVGVLAAAATAGQLAGSAAASALAAAGAPTALPAAAAAVLYMAARHHASGISPAPGSAADRKPAPAAAALPLLAGARAAAADARVRWLALVIISGSTLSAWGYLLKSGVVAAATPDERERLAAFATINVASALAVAVLQATVTTPALAALPLSAALAAQPAAAALAALVVAAAPGAATVAAGELGRKAVAYVLARPGRETAFASLPPGVLYQARTTLDALCPRAGDAIACAVAAALAAALGGGAVPPRTTALAGLPLAAAAGAAAVAAGRALARARRPSSPLGP